MTDEDIKLDYAWLVNALVSLVIHIAFVVKFAVLLGLGI